MTSKEEGPRREAGASGALSESTARAVQPSMKPGRSGSATTTRYLSTTDVAKRLGITRATVSKYRLPEPDATIGTVRGWLPETIDRWDAARPGQGARTDRNREAARLSRS